MKKRVRLEISKINDAFVESNLSKMSSLANKNQEFLSLANAAAEFGVSQDYLRFLIFKKKLRAVKLGRNWVTTRGWLAEQRHSVKKIGGASLIENTAVIPQEHSLIAKNGYRGFAKRIAISLVLLILIFTISVIYTKAGIISLASPTQALARIDETVGNFIISFQLQSPKKIISDARNDFRDIFTAARLPSAENLYIAFRNAGKAVISSFSSFQKIVGLKAPPPPTEKKSVAGIPQTTPSSESPAKIPLEIVQVREITEHKEIVSTADVSLFQKKLDELNGYINSQVATLMRDIFALTTKVDSKTAFTVFAQSQKIDQLISPTIISGLTISSGNLTSSGGFSFTGAGSIGGALEVNKNLSSGGLLTVSGTGTSTFSSNVSVGGNFQIGGACLNCGGVSSFAGWTQSGSNVFLTTPTNSVGLGTSTPGAKFSVSGPGLIQDTLLVGGTLKATSTTLLATEGGRVGIGTTSPASLLSISGPFLAQGTSTLNGAGLIADSLFSTTTLNFYTASNISPRLTIDASGNLGVGTTSPGARINIAQLINGTPFIAALRATDVAPSGDFITYKSAGGTVLFRVDNSGNLLAGGIINSGSQTITSASAPQFRVQFDPANEMTVSVTNIGSTTLAFNGANSAAVFIPQNNQINAFNFENAAGASVLDIDTQNQRVGIGTTTPGARLAVQAGATLLGGEATIYGPLTLSFLNATSSTASRFVNASTTASFSIGNLLTVSGSGTSTFAGQLDTAGNTRVQGGLEILGAAKFAGALNITSAGTSTYTGGLAAAGLSSSAGLTISAGDLIASGGKLTVSGAGTSTISGGLSVGATGGLASSAGLTITGGSILATNIGAVFGSTTAVSPSFSNGALISSGDLLVNTGKVVSGGTGTSTFSGLSAAALRSTTGGITSDAGDLLLTGGKIVSTGGGTSTFSGGISTAGLSSSAGLNISAGDALFSGLIKELNTGTSTFTGGLAAAGLQSTANGLRVSAGDTVLAGGLQVAGGSNFTGNVGIGTAGPGRQTVISGANQTTANITDSGNTGGQILLFDTGGAVGNGGSVLFGAANSINNNNPIAAIKSFITNGSGTGGPAGDLLLLTRNSTADTSLTERMRILNNGNVGIGTAAPATPLAVVGGVRLGDSATIAGTSNALTVRRAAADSAIYFTLIDEFSVTQTIASGGAGRRQDLVFSNDASGNYIFNTGNVGIGTTSPFANLSVNQATGQFGFAVGSTSATSFIVNERGDVGVGINPANLGSNVVNRGDLANPRLGVYFNSGAATDTTKALIAADIDVTGQARNRVFVVYANGDVRLDGSLNLQGAITLGGGGADYAEWLETNDTDLETGELVSVDTSNANHIKRTVKAADSYLMGIISTKPGIIGGFRNGEGGDPHWKQVAFLGQVPTKVAGDIAIGDRITSSDIPGVGRKAKAGEPNVCVAFEPHRGDTVDKINCLISRNNFGYSRLDNTAVSLASSSSTSTGVPWSVDPYLGKVNVVFSGDINLKGNALLDVGRISGMWGKWSIDESGKIVAKEVETENLLVKKQTTFGTSDAPQGITIYDRATKQPVCVFSEHGALRSEAGACGSITAPSVLPAPAQPTQPISGNTTATITATTTAVMVIPNQTATSTQIDINVMATSTPTSTSTVTATP